MSLEDLKYSNQNFYREKIGKYEFEIDMKNADHDVDSDSRYFAWFEVRCTDFELGHYDYTELDINLFFYFTQDEYETFTRNDLPKIIKKKVEDPADSDVFIKATGRFMDKENNDTLVNPNLIKGKSIYEFFVEGLDKSSDEVLASNKKEKENKYSLTIGAILEYYNPHYTDVMPESDEAVEKWIVELFKDYFASTIFNAYQICAVNDARVQFIEDKNGILDPENIYISLNFATSKRISDKTAFLAIVEDCLKDTDNCPLPGMSEVAQARMQIDASFIKISKIGLKRA